MAMKLATLVIATLLIGAGILAERHRQFQAAHDLAAAHHQIDVSRRELWQLQTQLAERLRPQSLGRELIDGGRSFGPMTSETTDPRPLGVAPHMDMASASGTPAGATP